METTMKKGKAVAVSISDESLDEKKSDPSAMSAGRISARNASSKYDFVKVKVWLGDNADHYYVLSRFLLSRMLTVTKIPNHVAIKIALELKKLLIDNSLLDVSQSDLEANLFKLMERRGYGEEYINRYRMMTRFHHQRVPLVILVCGTACAGKSTIATQLAQRLNLPNVLQTDMVYELLRTSTDAPLVSNPVWARDFNSPEELITEFCRECRIVRKGLAGDLKKAMKDGKPIIIEGIHIDPSIYLMDEEKTTNSNTRKDETNMVPITSNDNNGAPIDHSTEVSSGDQISSTTKAPVLEEDKSSPNVESKEEGMLDSQSTDVRDHPGCVGLEDNTCHAVENGSVHQGETLKEPDPQTNSPVKKEKPAAEPIIVPIVLRMAEFDHKALLEEWISTRTFGDKCLTQDQDKLISNLKTIQDYLCSFESRGLTVVNISATTFPQTLDWLHSHLLQCIEKGIIAAEARAKAQDNPDVQIG